MSSFLNFAASVMRKEHPCHGTLFSFHSSFGELGPTAITYTFNAYKYVVSRRYNQTPVTYQ
ncbi:hypothetical protein Hanom_Chr11g01038901 [Helianthus anomalus]